MNTEQQYINGFNTGYVLAKHELLLLKKITSSVSIATDFLKGMFAGMQHIEIERTKNELSILKGIRSEENFKKDFDRGNQH